MRTLTSGALSGPGINRLDTVTSSFDDRTVAVKDSLAHFLYCWKFSGLLSTSGNTENISLNSG
ncbi:hypothetical protein ACT7CR_09185 [Bacillus paranthracis]